MKSSLPTYRGGKFYLSNVQKRHIITILYGLGTYYFPTSQAAFQAVQKRQGRPSYFVPVPSRWISRAKFEGGVSKYMYVGMYLSINSAWIVQPGISSSHCTNEAIRLLYRL